MYSKCPGLLVWRCGPLCLLLGWRTAPPKSVPPGRCQTWGELGYLSPTPPSPHFSSSQIPNQGRCSRITACRDVDCVCRLWHRLIYFKKLPCWWVISFADDIKCCSRSGLEFLSHSILASCSCSPASPPVTPSLSFAARVLSAFTNRWLQLILIIFCLNWADS